MKKPTSPLSLVAGACLLLAALSISKVAQAAPVQLISNGGFETGLTGWTVTDLAGSSGSFFAVAPGAAGPLSGLSTSALGGMPHGTGIALSDQTGPGTHALLQSFVVAPGAASVILSFDMFANNYGVAPPVCGPGLDHTGSSVQCGRVDILSALAGAFDTGASVLGNFYLGADGGANPNPFTSYSFDITALVGAGGTFQLRFAESDNTGFFTQGVDNVSILADATAVPEPATVALVGIALLGAVGASRRKKV